ncbi:hypothetical protein [Xenorhabdus griffiniae]|uniref:Uncharacterized protein n=1 Tax=Xenorhabdus griffiniae TaxID=351672 RepID=A0ABY9XF43_9GAMM|nr:hypothetical protein [Xenorhabdus griffiniae]MBD1228898.1 hypothetical protein [Xenorhabdus griffiniae]MBE8588570.1 hypothetical protein [Xenorhabdus griffiniae]WMV71536.1 hypothetical protein QL128_15470 [Xenorhabdus griffiniae]WNH01213.1 hypothetical protein QL112_015475 [Xenorhabdus griffiniae]
MKDSDALNKVSSSDLEKISVSLSRTTQMIKPSGTDQPKGLFVIKSKTDPLDAKLMEQCCIR